MHRLIHRRSATPGTPAAPVPFKSKLTKRTLSAVAPMATIAFMSIAFCCLLSGHLAAITSDIPRYLSPVAARYEGHVESSYGVEGGYWGLSVNYSYPSLSLVDRTRYLVANSSCWELAKSHAEPYCKDYQATQMTPLVTFQGRNIAQRHLWCRANCCQLSQRSNWMVEQLAAPRVSHPFKY